MSGEQEVILHPAKKCPINRQKREERPTVNSQVLFLVVFINIYIIQ